MLSATAAVRADPYTDFLNGRRRLISDLFRLIETLDSHQDAASRVRLTRLCDNLVDYLSAGHFQIFSEIATDNHAYGQIERTTDRAMRFNDRFGASGSHDTAAVKRALEGLALTLETRFVLEDALIGAA